MAACLSLLEDGRPNSLVQCRSDDGSIDLRKCMQCNHKQNELHQLERNVMEEEDSVDEEIDSESTAARSSRKRTRRAQSLRPCCFDDEGNVVYLTPEKTTWYFMHVKSSPQSVVMQAKFRRRFRMPYDQFKVLLSMVMAHEYFARWTRRNAAGKKPSPIELLLLGALRYLGRGLTFDDLEECTAIRPTVSSFMSLSSTGETICTHSMFTIHGQQTNFAPIKMNST